MNVSRRVRVARRAGFAELFRGIPIPKPGLHDRELGDEQEFSG
jgi:hypothetical protein